MKREGSDPALIGRPADAATPPRNPLAAVRAGVLRSLGTLIENLGGDAAALLRRFHVGLATVDDCGDGLSHRLAQLLEQASIELDCPDFGLRLAALQAEQGVTRILGPMDVAMRNSPTLGGALRYCADHIHAYSTAAQIGFERLPDDGRILMQFEILLGGLSYQRQAVEYMLALARHTIAALSGGQARAGEVWFTHRPLAPLSAYRAHFNSALRFGCSMNGLFFDERDFARPVPDADPQLHEIATAYIDHRFPALPASLGNRVRIIIARLLMEGRCTHERVAAALGLHLRTLQRRLREEGESFESIKDAVRREIALRYLRQPEVPLVKVTEILGYSETSVLSRSCHRWFSASPRQLRSQLRYLNASSSRPRIAAQERAAAEAL